MAVLCRCCSGHIDGNDCRRSLCKAACKGDRASRGRRDRACAGRREVVDLQDGAIDGSERALVGDGGRGEFKYLADDKGVRSIGDDLATIEYRTCQLRLRAAAAQDHTRIERKRSGRLAADWADPVDRAAVNSGGYIREAGTVAELNRAETVEVLRRDVPVERQIANQDQGAKTVQQNVSFDRNVFKCAYSAEG